VTDLKARLAAITARCAAAQAEYGAVYDETSPVGRGIEQANWATRWADDLVADNVRLTEALTRAVEALRRIKLETFEVHTEVLVEEVLAALDRLAEEEKG
jgi:hypothetical protein